DGRKHRIGEERQVAKGPRVLKSAGHAALHDFPGPQASDVLAAENDAPRIGAQDLGDQAQKGGLPRAVGPDQAHDLVARKLEAHRVDGGEAAETLGERVNAEKWRSQAIYRSVRSCKGC